MARMVWRWAAAITLAGGSLAAAQPWPAVPPVHGSPPPAPRYESKPPADEPLFVIRTAGQADRIVRVVHPAKDADGLAEVKDTATGQTFNIPGKVLARLPRANATKPDPAPTPPAEAKPDPRPEPVKPPTDPLPQLPTTTIRPARLEMVDRPTLQPLAIPPPQGERMVVTWRAEDPPAPAPTPAAKPATPSLLTTKPTPADPWRAAGPEKPPVAPPSPAPAPTWKPTSPPKPKVDPNDPWRPSGG